METADALSTIALAAVALVGFAGLLAAIRGEGAVWALSDVTRVKWILLVAVSAFVFAVIPLPLLLAGAESRAVWRLLAAVFGVHMLLLFVSAVTDALQGRLRPRSKSLFGSLLAGGGVIALVLFAAAAALTEMPAPAAYCLALLWLLVIAIFQFMIQAYALLAPPGLSEDVPRTDRSAP